MRRRKSLPGREKVRPVVYGIGLYFLLSGMDSFQIGSIGSLLKVVALVPLALSLLDIRRWKLHISATLGAQLLFWLLAVASILYSISAEMTLSSVIPLTLNFSLVFCLGIMEHYTDRELQLMQRALLAGGWITIALLLLFSDYSLHGRLTLLLGGKTQDQNYINGYFLYTFSWHCCQLLTQKKRRHIIPIFFILYIVLMTGSRGALLAFLLVTLFHACIMFEHAKHRMRNIILLVLVMVLLAVSFEQILAWLPESVAQRFSPAYIAKKGTTGRTQIWDFLLRHFFSDSIPRMIFGHGYGTTMQVNTMDGRVAHNLYLDNLITLGFLGLLLQLTIQGSLLRMQHRHSLHALMGAYWGMLAMCLSMSLVVYKPMWNIMLLTLAIDINRRSKVRPAVRPGAACTALRTGTPSDPGGL